MCCPRFRAPRLKLRVECLPVGADAGIAEAAVLCVSYRSNNLLIQTTLAKIFIYETDHATYK
jgi:hypothetical protein